MCCNYPLLNDFNWLHVHNYLAVRSSIHTPQFEVEITTRAVCILKGIPTSEIHACAHVTVALTNYNYRFSPQDYTLK
jgi:hypothetical protein